MNEDDRIQRIGVFGGSFDPVHLGHLWIAESAIETLALDQLRWIPAAQSPLKPTSPAASAENRFQMVGLAVSGCQKHVVDDREIRRGNISYTIDTLTELHEEFPNNQWWLIIGSDSLASIQNWREPERLLQLARLAVVQRGGQEPIDFSVLDGLASTEQIDRIHQDVVRMPVIEVSSTELRERVANDRSIRFRTPRAVEALIGDKNLYRL